MQFSCTQTNYEMDLGGGQREGCFDHSLQAYMKMDFLQRNIIDIIFSSEKYKVKQG